MTEAERDKALLELLKISAELLKVAHAMNHIVANTQNVTNLFVASEERLRRSPAWVARHLASMIRSPDVDVVFDEAELLAAITELDKARLELKRALREKP